MPGECGERAMRVAREHASPPRDERAPHDALSARARVFTTIATSFNVCGCTVSIIYTQNLHISFQEVMYFCEVIKVCLVMYLCE